MVGTKITSAYYDGAMNTLNEIFFYKKNKIKFSGTLYGCPIHYKTTELNKKTEEELPWLLLHNYAVKTCTKPC